MPSITTRELATLVDGVLRGTGERLINDVSTLDDATETHVCFIDGRGSLNKPPNSSIGAVILSEELADDCLAEEAELIVVDDPQAAFVTAMMHLRPQAVRRQIGISPRAHVSPAAQVAFGTDVFPGATIGDDVVCGTGCVIHPGVHIGEGCRIGDDVTIYPNAVLYPHSVVGDRVLIHATAVIGADGFGYRFAEGRFQKIPHTGNVIIGDDVEIGAGTTVDRGMIGPTVIGAGTKLDNQVMIAHNCRVGKHNAFASQVGFAGSSTSGDYVRCGGQAGIADHSHLGTGCSVGAKAGHFGTVPDGVDYHGCPAGPSKEQYRIVMTMQKLPEMRKQLSKLRKEVERLKSKLPMTPPSSEVESQSEAADGSSTAAA